MIAPCGQCVALLTVFIISLWVPVSAPNPIDQSRIDPIALDGKRVIGVGDVEVLHSLEIVAGSNDLPGGRRKPSGNVSPQGLPHQPDALGRRRLVASVDEPRQSSGKGIALPDVVTGRAHSRENLIGFSITADVATCAGEAARDDGVPAVQQPFEHGGEVALASQNGAHLYGVGFVDAGPRSDKRCLHLVDPQLPENRLVLIPSPSQAQIVEAGSVDQLHDLAATARRSHQELLRHSPLLGMKQQGLLRGQGPGVAKTIFKIGADEVPVGGIPGGGFSDRLVRARWNIPAVDDRTDEPLLRETFALSPRKVLRANDGPTLLLKAMQRFERISQLLLRRRQCVLSFVSQLNLPRCFSPLMLYQISLLMSR
ncbi:hypothetical protein D3C72_927480 [compost metagenome]